MSLTDAPVAMPTGTAPSNDEANAITAKIWFDGQLIDADSPRAPLTTHAMHYGSGVFEGIRSYATVDGGAAVFRLPEHLARMRAGADLLGIDFDIAQATSATLAVLRANRHRDAYIRPLTWCGTGSIGLDVAPLSKHLMVATFAIGVHLAGGRVKLGVSSWRRNPATSLPPLKLCGAYVNSILAKHEAMARGFDEALFVDAQGDVVECTGANVFMVRDDRVVAVDHPDALPGITRDSLIALTGAQSRTVSLEELRDADEVFVCGTAAEVTPIDSLDGRTYADSDVGREAARLYRRVVTGADARYRDWLTDV
ncbi:aminotransferase class IV [Montanilutibacter psychrotolerans]|uniref:branched-chain-amino-acid transaminase n=1 Tax=Montanilutibacter psychrotolerans TaxID=1327343 RepID=A0A3M8SKP0_9GAMM|nr:aminotransferase class IV [Lysobacter psychrotolerans]RNF81917.1 branched chain amino acid aminotransferase [Lysobacter psychrotolerans]